MPLSADLGDLVTDYAAPGLAASLAVAPATIEDVARVLTVAAARGIGVVPFGSGSHIVDPGADIAVSTHKLAGIVDYQPDDLTIVVGAGMRLGDLEATLAGRGLTAVLPENAPDRTVGGVVASGASGYRRYKYGPTRDRVLEVTMATGYGEVVRAGGRLVKNVTGYDVARLMTGSFGSLGIIGSVCLKLWPASRLRRTVTVEDAAGALSSLYKPVAVLETSAGSYVYLEGHETTLDSQVASLCGVARAGFAWPDVGATQLRASLRVPARHIAAGIGAAGELDPDWFVAHHGVGLIDMGIGAFDPVTIDRVRGWAEALGGSMALFGQGLSNEQRWGSPPATLTIQRRMKDLFDPAGVCNPGVLPGGL